MVEAKERDPLDRFYTPDGLALKIAQNVAEMVPEARAFLEPSSGGGAFLRAIHATWDLPAAESGLPGGAWHGPNSVRVQLPDGRDTWDIQAVDLDSDARTIAEGQGAYFRHAGFLDYAPSPVDVVLMNPPFSATPAPGRKLGLPNTADHIEHALKALRVDGVCAALVRASFLSTVERAKLFTRYVPALVEIIVERPSFTLGGTDQHEYVAIYWQRFNRLRFARPGSTRMRWLSWK